MACVSETGVGFLLLTLVAGGCTKGQDETATVRVRPPVVERVEAEPSSARAHPPPIGTADAEAPGLLDPRHAPATAPVVSLGSTYPDGSWSVGALNRRRSIAVGDAFRVRARVRSIYTCPPCPPPVSCKPCQKAHIVLEDPGEGGHVIVLFGVEAAVRPGAKHRLVEGHTFVVEGTYRGANLHFIPNPGLALEYSRHEPAQ